MLFFSALLCLAASASAVPSCDECTDALTGLVARLTSEESIAEQVAILVATVCPGTSDPAHCAEELPIAWPEIATAMYPVFLEANSVCGQLGACAKNKEWTCEECTGGIEAIATIINDPATIADIITFLQGDAFCANHADVAECPDVC